MQWKRKCLIPIIEKIIITIDIRRVFFLKLREASTQSVKSGTLCRTDSQLINLQSVGQSVRSITRPFTQSVNLVSQAVSDLLHKQGDRC